MEEPEKGVVDLHADSILFVSTFPPRECGIATFTRDLAESLEKRFAPHLKSKILAMNNNGMNIYNYPKCVIYQLSDTDRAQYAKMADEVNRNDSIKIVSIQHEFGIYGGDYGEYLIDFLSRLRKPKIITFHSILPNPNAQRLEVIQKIADNIDRIIVMTDAGVEILRNEYSIKTEIKVVPHGIPSVEYEKQENAKRQLGYHGKIILSSFGMINSGKGYEYVIQSLPEVVKLYPNLVYLIIGATHPIVRRSEGEKYRNFLQQKVKELGLTEHVKFYNKYVTLSEIIQYLKATDIYISSTLTPEQITSGTLSYALGCGRAAISTPFLHAKDLMKDGKGILLNDFHNAKYFEKALLELLSNKKKVRDIELTSYEGTRHMTWQNVALSYGEEMRDYMDLPDICFEQLPQINTRHIQKMTDNFGILQFAKYTSPNKSSGYTLDDNARALLVAAKLYSRFQSRKFLELTSTYLNYMKYVQNDDGRFYNLVTKEKKIDKNSWSEEAHGRAIQTLGLISSMQVLPRDLRDESANMLIKSLVACGEINSARAIAAVTIGLYHYNRENYSNYIVKTIKKFADHLIELYNHHSTPDWKWFEQELTYANSKISEALFCAYIATQQEKYFEIAKESLNFLISKTFEKEVFVPIGQNGWYKKGGKRAYFDQQPIDVGAMVQTLIMAYKITNKTEYEKYALRAFQWFLGKNTLNQVVYNEKTGGCCDGLDEKGANLNCGAESTLSYLNARLEIEELI